MQSAPVEGIHSSVTHRIDDVYLETIDQAAKLMDYLDSPRGTIDGAYKRFKNPFYQLFLLTHNIKAMRPCSGTSDKLRVWIAKPVSKKAAREGLAILTEYQKCLFDNMIISQRDAR